jgi:hypothetical protein
MDRTNALEKKTIIHQLEEAKKALELSHLQKHGLQRALAKRIGTESRDIETLLASSNSNPRKLALVILNERESSRKRIQNLQDQLQLTELQLTKKQNFTKLRNNRKEKTVSRLRQHVVDLEDENKKLTEENEELMEENHTLSSINFAAAFASCKKKEGDSDQEDAKLQQQHHQRQRRHQRQQRQLKRQLKQHSVSLPSISNNSKEHSSSNTKKRKETMREREKRKRRERRKKQIKAAEDERKKYIKRVHRRENDLIKNSKIHRTGYAVGARAKRVPEKTKTWKYYMELPQKKEVPM